MRFETSSHWRKFVAPPLLGMAAITLLGHGRTPSIHFVQIQKTFACSFSDRGSPSFFRYRCLSRILLIVCLYCCRYSSLPGDLSAMDPSDVPAGLHGMKSFPFFGGFSFHGQPLFSEDSRLSKTARRVMASRLLAGLNRMQFSVGSHLIDLVASL